jgi:poly [ADP-ribose] polymerase
LRYEDQQRLKTQISNIGPMPSKGKGKKRSAAEMVALDDYGIEYSANARAGCRGCELKIIKQEIRVKKVIYDSEVALKYGSQATWYHLECFAKVNCRCSV